MFIVSCINDLPKYIQVCVGLNFSAKKGIEKRENVHRALKLILPKEIDQLFSMFLQEELKSSLQQRIYVTFILFSAPFNNCSIRRAARARDKAKGEPFSFCMKDVRNYEKNLKLNMKRVRLHSRFFSFKPLFELLFA